MNKSEVCYCGQKITNKNRVILEAWLNDASRRIEFCSEDCMRLKLKEASMFNNAEDYGFTTNFQYLDKAQGYWIAVFTANKINTEVEDVQYW